MLRGRIKFVVGVAVAVTVIAVLVVYLAGRGAGINALEIQGLEKIGQWECAKYSVVADPQLSNLPATVTVSTSALSTKLYSDFQCQIEVQSIPLNKRGPSRPRADRVLSLESSTSTRSRRRTSKR